MPEISEDYIRKNWEENPMLMPRIDKAVVNLSVGKSGEPLERAVRVLKELTGHEPSRRKAKQTIREFGVRKGEAIACMVTLRYEEAIEFMKRVLPVVDNKISKRAFDKQGNFSFGIKEHIEIPGVKYDPEIGIFGMDVCVTVTRPGYRVKNRRREQTKIGSKHVLTPQESMIFIKDTLGAEII
jgi:large subunit ribosomal protein L5